MTVPKVFIASSSEGLIFPVGELLSQALGETVKVSPWTEEFRLTRFYIESLEDVLDTSDFAVAVFTLDDVTLSRTANRPSPRDNVIFELGLFFGRLGRERCFIVKRHDQDLKLPTDLLGIEPAQFEISPGQDLKGALGTACARVAAEIKEAIRNLPSRPRLNRADREAQASIRRFGDQITGYWWEQIDSPGEELALGFFSIERDDRHNSIRLWGRAYDLNGTHVATWTSGAVRLEDRKIRYVRECERLDTGSRGSRPGLAEINFDDIDQPYGKFWETDPSHPEGTVQKSVDLRRSLDEHHQSTMIHRSEDARKALVKNILHNWPEVGSKTIS